MTSPSASISPSGSASKSASSSISASTSPSPSPAAGNYGSIEGVGALVPKHAGTSGNFTATTHPTSAQVVSYIDDISAILDIMLSAAGFVTPVTQAKCKRALDLFADQEVAAVVEGINGAGRFGPTLGKGTPKGRWAIMLTDAQAFIEKMAIGFERLGATRTYDETSGIGFREFDQSGDSVPPLFERKAYGDDAFQQEWDSD